MLTPLTHPPASSTYLQVRLMHERGYTVGNIDCTIIAQRPKLSPHKETIRQNLCRLLGADPSGRAGVPGPRCASVGGLGI